MDTQARVRPPKMDRTQLGSARAASPALVGMLFSTGITASWGLRDQAASTVVAAGLGVGWLLGYRGRVRLQPALVSDQQRRRPSHG